MIENILTNKQASLRVKLTVKTLISTAIIILAVVLPQIAHAAAGAQAGITLLPMYLPVLLGGCLLGPVWGLGVGVLSPLASFLITSALGTPMPAAAKARMAGISCSTARSGKRQSIFAAGGCTVSEHHSIYCHRNLGTDQNRAYRYCPSGSYSSSDGNRT